jgi:hypothetical protein
MISNKVLPPRQIWLEADQKVWKVCEFLILKKLITVQKKENGRDSSAGPI